MGVAYKYYTSARIPVFSRAHHRESAYIEKRRINMIKRKVSAPLIGLIASTRGMLGAGAALLFLSDMPREKRRKLGWALFLTGVLSTFPLGYKVFRS
jgi:hypothetical protein